MKLILSALAMLLVVEAGPASPCKNPKTGKFIKSATAAPAKLVRCKDA